MTEKISYRDVLLSRAASVAHSMSDAIYLAATMNDEIAIQILERRLDQVAEVADYHHLNSETVEARPAKKGVPNEH